MRKLQMVACIKIAPSTNFQYVANPLSSMTASRSQRQSEKRNPMAKYFAIYMAPVSAVESWMASTTPEQRKAGAQEWEKWSKDHALDLADAGGPLGKTKRVTANGIA